MGPQSFIPHKFPAYSRLLLTVLFLSVAVMRCQTLATSVSLILPTNVVVDVDGNLYVSETARHVVRKVDVHGQMTTVAGTGTQGFGGDGGAAISALLDSPLGLAVGGGKLYIADSHNHRVRRVDLATNVIATVAGGSSAGSGGDGGMAVDASLDMPAALAISSQGDLYISDVRAHRIRRIATNGVMTTVAGVGVQGFSGDSGPSAAALLDSPGGLAVDAAGDLYIADTHNHRVRRVNVFSGSITTIVGMGVVNFLGDAGPAGSASVALPRGLSIDQQGNVFIADTLNHRVRRIDAVSGIITTIAGDGTQAFQGDGGPAVSASLDSPGAVAVSSAGIFDIADTGNARVRQVAADATIQTVSGGGVAVGQLTISGQSSVTYGSGKLTVNLSGAGGSVSFSDSYHGLSSVLASSPLRSGAAVLDLSMLPVGQHSIVANYGGDQAHAAAQSQVFALTVNPIALTAAVSPASIIYGSAGPLLSGSLSGVLARDQSSVSANFSTSIAPLSSVGIYPVAVALSGAAAGNYTIASSPALMITPAATLTTLSVASTTLVNGNVVDSGQALLMGAHVASATTGIPTGTVTVFDGGIVVDSAKMSPSGDVAITSSTLSAGAHSLTASYSGDGNFRVSLSTPLSITVGSPSGGTADFSILATGNVTQNIIAGGTASFTFTVQPQAALASQITLAAAGLPNLATASFNPAYIPPGGPATTVTVTIATPRSAMRDSRTSKLVLAGLMMPIAFSLLTRVRKGKGLPLLAMFVAALLPGLSGCGDRVYTGSDATKTSQTYTISVTGTATASAGASIQHSVTFQLLVTPAS